MLTVFTAALAAIGFGCQPNENVPKPAAVPAASPAVSPAVTPTPSTIDKLLGKWDGPEGTYITVAGAAPGTNSDGSVKKYSIEIKNLDKSEKFEGIGKDGVIEFIRKGKTETVRAATGPETGMKGVEKETNCVVINKGSEGFCRKQ